MSADRVGVSATTEAMTTMRMSAVSAARAVGRSRFTEMTGA
jgi:hypothetical protein